MAKLLYTIGETAGLLGESTSAVRYWSNYFEKYIKPSRKKILDLPPGGRYTV